MARVSQALRSSDTNTRLPSDFDIFSPSIRTIAWCIQWRTNGSPVAASDWAASHSWWGKIRSASAAVQVDRRAQLAHGERRALDVPPRPARSPQRLPRRLVRGRRLPQHEVERVALVGVVDVAAPLGGQAQHLVAVEVADLAEALEAGHVEVDAAAGLVGVAPVEHHADEARGCRRWPRWPGARSRRAACRGPACRRRSGRSRRRPGRGSGRPSSRALRRMSSSTSVMLRTQRVSWPTVAQPALQHVVGEVGGGVADVGGVVRRDAARVHRDHRARGERDDLAARRVVEPHRLAHGRRRRSRGRLARALPAPARCPAGRPGSLGCRLGGRGRRRGCR